MAIIDCQKKSVVQNRAVKMANPIQALNENFFYNSMLARALVQLLPVKQRCTIRVWLEKLHQMDETPDEMTIRNDYMWFLLLMLQSKRITVPFTHVPPLDIRPLKQILPTEVYEEILMATDQNMSWLEQVGVSNTSMQKVQSTGKIEPITSHPANFLENQPIPKNGVICYLSVFSDHDY